MNRIERPFFPIVYVRGYAMPQSEIGETVATPYMGFNLGATKVRQDWEGKVARHIFESPLIRLMKDHGYRDTYADGTERTGTLAPKREETNLNAPRSPVFAVDIAVSATDYVVGDSFWNKQRIEGEHLFRNTIVIRAKQGDNGWEVRYNMADDAWAENTGHAVEQDLTGMYVPCTSGKGFKAKLRLRARELA